MNRSTIYMLGWFIIPVEVLFRHSFGQRWLTLRLFFHGLGVLCLFTALQFLYNWLALESTPLLEKYDLYHPSESASVWNEFLDRSMLFILAAYLLVGFVHFFKMWWKSRTYNALHSYDDGISWFQPIGRGCVKLINLLASPFLRIFMLLLVRGGRKKRVPPLIDDVAAFTDIVIEPLVLLALVFVFSGLTCVWLVISAIASAIYATKKKISKNQKMMDMRDNLISAYTMERHKIAPRPKARRPFRFAWPKRKRKVQSTFSPEQHYPDLEDIIEDMHKVDMPMKLTPLGQSKVTPLS